MRVDADRPQYWRRRIVVLGGVLAAAGSLLWACGGGEDEPVRRIVRDVTPPPPPTAMPTVTVTVREIARECVADDLAATLRATRDAYAGTSPRFRVSVVNTGEEPCALGKGTLDVRITSGSDRVWSSARCGQGTSRLLRSGAPFSDTITWDRRRACGGAEAGPGTYVASLAGTGEQVFRLR
ncbi:hypothetical protein [Spirillospora albida]|uniref:hypothetical protein n=1 Tax=Spirillospora albida TaxID=58123 RepID=UPI00068DC45F|nr:hypothetical protein [Spirillospora albida]